MPVSRRAVTVSPDSEEGEKVMIYLREFSMLTRKQEEDFFTDPTNVKARRTCYTTKYPYGVFRYRELPSFEFEPITILYGGNGSGKSTILNVMAEKLRVRRGAVFNRSDFYDDYVSACRYKLERGKSIPEESKIITSDDVFDYLLDIRCINDGIDTTRAKLFDKYVSDKYEPYQLRSLDDYEEFRRRSDAKSKSQSQYVKDRLMRNVQERSNGESALIYFTDSIKENALYLLDEPENSLSASLQLELKKFIEDSVRFFKCQFVISTHSPFLLSMEGAKVYDLDVTPPEARPWTELENVRIYHEFFAEHAHEF